MPVVSTRKTPFSMTGRRLLLVVVAGVGAAVVAFAGAQALDDPVGAGPIDEAQPIVVGAIVEPGAELTGIRGDLPPLSLVLDEPPPAEIVGLPLEDRVERLREIAGDDPGLLLQLGVALQSTGDSPGAREAYERAAENAPDARGPEVGLLMADAASGSAGLERASQEIDVLAAAAPRDQLVAFNQGWLAVYRRDAQSALAAWERARQIDAQTPLGIAAAELTAAIARGADGG